MSRDGSDWDYINEHMGGHDDDGMPNFLKQSIKSCYVKENVEGSNEKTSESEDVDVESIRSYYILKNLIARIELENASLSQITDIEMKTLKYALSRLEDMEIPF